MKLKAKIAIFAVSIMLQSTSALSIAIGGISAAFPDASVSSIQLVFTLVSLASLLGTLLAGKLAGVTTKKALVILFSLLTFVAATIGYFFHGNLTLLYGVSVAMGLGIGVASPICTALIAEIFDGGERAAVNGLQSLFINGGAVAINMVAGILVSSAWENVYLVYSVLVVTSIVCAVLLPKGIVEKAEEGERVKLFNPFLVTLLLQSFVLGLAWMTLMTNASFAVIELGGNEGQASLLTMAQFAGGIAIGLILRPVMQKVGKHCFVVAHAIAAIGLWTLFLAPSLPVLVAGSFLLGVGFGLFMPAGYTLIPNNVHPAAITMSLSIFLGFFMLGGFCNPYVVTSGAALLDGAVDTRFMIAAAIQTANIAICIICTKLFMKDSATL